MRLLVHDVDRDFEVDVIADKIWFFRGPPGWVPPGMPGDAQGISLTCPSVNRPGHCCIEVVGDRLRVHDLGARSGVIVERAGLFHRVEGPFALKRHDLVHLGRPTIERLD